VTTDAAIFDHSGRILLIQRADNGRWAMPGGAAEVGETPSEAVVREVREETQLDVVATRLVAAEARLAHVSLFGRRMHA
jgi:ADP-ribose pyrophosphatase YjhB (NUDIX family)